MGTVPAVVITVGTFWVMGVCLSRFPTDTESPGPIVNRALGMSRGMVEFNILTWYRSCVYCPQHVTIQDGVAVSARLAA